MTGFELLRPSLAWLPLVAFVLLAVGLWGLARRSAELRRFVFPARLARFAPGLSRGRAVARVLFASAAAFLLAFSALGPVSGYTEREVKQRGLDLVVCIDTSRSMLARDLRPSRLERAKREVVGLIDRLRGDRCALIAFSGDAREIAPLTRDRAALKAFLDEVDTEQNRRGGTDLAAAIELGLSLFDGRTGAHEALVLLTDGEDLEARAAELAGVAAERGIRVYVVGVGTEGGGKIPIRLPDGGEGFMRDPSGQEVVTRLEGASLAFIAERTGGDYLSTEQSPTPLEDLYASRISRLEGREIEEGLRRVPHDRYQWTLACGLFCMLIEVGLRERRRLRGVPA